MEEKIEATVTENTNIDTVVVHARTNDLTNNIKKVHLSLKKLTGNSIST